MANVKWTVMKIEIKMIDGKSILKLATPAESPEGIYAMKNIQGYSKIHVYKCVISYYIIN